MFRRLGFWSTAVAAGLGLVACGDDVTLEFPDPAATHEAFFEGYIYDGAVGARLTTYKLEGTFRDRKFEGTVEDGGRFVVGPFDPFSDYTITITAAGYRLFRSHNGAVGLPPELAQTDAIAEVATNRALHFDAYLFPAELPSPEVAFKFRGVLPEDEEELEGKVRLRPTSAPALQNEASETPAGVEFPALAPDGEVVMRRQLWTNDEDLQGLPLTRNFEKSEFLVEKGELVYGVNYAVDVYDVPGYQPAKSTIQPGFVADATIQLTPEITAPLELVEVNDDECKAPTSPTATTSAVVTFTFNKVIELAEPDSPGEFEEALDDGFSLDSNDDDFDDVRNELAPDDGPETQNRGVTFTISGKTLTLSFDASKGLVSKDADDEIDSVTYSNFGSISLQPEKRPHLAATLSTLAKRSSLTCY